MHKLKFRVSFLSAVSLALLVIMLAGWGFASAFADETEDLSDNETCLDCHLDEEHIGLMTVEGKQVHNPEDGSLKVEAHTEFSCIDCHGDISEIPHKEEVERTVNCLDCHEKTPD